ncbi:MAG: DUF2089 domain-containing protein [Deltaproteobacteria bacterium]|nr:DUF2089 domain-containing protein [Deltaproteobacteria bacterium]
MSNFVTNCPSCREDLKATRLACVSCGVQLEGQFPIPDLLRLSPDELTFVVEFVKVSGSLKEMARREERSYPTIRNRLNEIIEKIKDLESSAVSSQDAILDAIAAGTLSATEGAAKLKELKK